MITDTATTTLEDRLAEATTSTNKWNFWPDKFEVVSVREIDMTDPVEAFDFGYLRGANQGMRQVDAKNLPPQAAGWLGNHRMLYHLVNVFFAESTAPGQADTRSKRNIFALFDPKKSWNYERQGYTFESPALIIELGCAHDLETTRTGNCYRAARCTRCGYEYEVDSSG